MKESVYKLVIGKVLKLIKAIIGMIRKNIELQFVTILMLIGFFSWLAFGNFFVNYGNI